eukprot:gene2866-5630_t
MCLYEIIKAKIENESGHKVQLHSLSEMNKAVVNSDLCLSANIRSMAEEIKKELSSKQETIFSCRVTLEDAGTIATTGGHDQFITFPIKRLDFEVGCSALFERSMVPVRRLLTELAMDKDDIDEVVLVGGTTRVPYVKHILREYFGKELNDHIDPDVTVAVGAASILDYKHNEKVFSQLLFTEAENIDIQSDNELPKMKFWNQNEGIQNHYEGIKFSCYLRIVPSMGFLRRKSCGYKFIIQNPCYVSACTTSVDSRIAQHIRHKKLWILVIKYRTCQFQETTKIFLAANHETFSNCFLHFYPQSPTTTTTTRSLTE